MRVEQQKYKGSIARPMYALLHPDNYLHQINKPSFSSPRNNNEEPIFEHVDENQIIDAIDIKQCYCTNCNKTIDIPPIRVKTNYATPESLAGETSLRLYDNSDKNLEVTCPECNYTSIGIRCIGPETHKGKFKDCYKLPEYIVNRYVFTEYNDENHPTKIIDNSITNSVLIHPSGKKMIFSREISNQTDLEKNTQLTMMYTMNPDKTKTCTDIKSIINPFGHNMETEKDIRTISASRLYKTNGIENQRNDMAYFKDFTGIQSFKSIDTLQSNFLQEEKNISDYILDTIAKERFDTYTYKNVIQPLKNAYSTSDDINSMVYNLSDNKNTLIYAMLHYPIVIQKLSDDIKSHDKWNPMNKYTEQDIKNMTNHTFEQLNAMNDKMLSYIAKAKSVDDMMNNFRQITTVFGDETVTSKKIKKALNADPYAVANTVYTAKSIGIMDINHIQTLMELINTDNAPTYKSSKLNTILPVQTADMRRFMRKYTQAHGQAETVETFYNANSSDYQILIDTAKMYSKVASCGIIVEDKDMLAEAQKLQQTQQIKNSINNLGVEQTIDNIVTAHGLEPDKAKEIVNEINNTEIDDTVYFIPRNNKPLIKGRKLREIHDELSIMVNQCERVNRPLKYPQSVKDRFNKVYDNGYSVQLATCTHDLIRTGQEMSICVGGYTDSAFEKNLHIATMRDPTGKQVACIEISKDYDKVHQFLGEHNVYLKGEPAKVGMQWLKDTNLNYSSCDDVKKFDSTSIARYGNGECDYHTYEIDEFGNVTTTQERNQRQNANDLPWLDDDIFDEPNGEFPFM